MAENNAGVGRPLRGKSYSIDEEIILCHAYLEISQDPVIGVNQKKEKFWERISILYHSRLPPHCTDVRTIKSLTNHISKIMKAISRYRGCRRQIENRHISGASETDIVNHTRELFSNCSEYKKKGFQYDHVWPIMKDVEKFVDVSTIETPIPRRKSNCSVESQSEECQTPKTMETSSFSINLNADEDGQASEYENVTPTSRPLGRNKEKMKRTKNDEKKNLAELIEKQQKLMESYNQNNSGRSADLISTMQRSSASRDLRTQMKIMMLDLDSIKNPNERKYWESMKNEIMEKRARDDQARQSSADTSHGNFDTSGYFQGGSSHDFDTTNFSRFGSFQGGYDGNGNDLPPF